MTRHHVASAPEEPNQPQPMNPTERHLLNRPGRIVLPQGIKHQKVLAGHRQRRGLFEGKLLQQTLNSNKKPLPAPQLPQLTLPLKQRLSTFNLCYNLPTQALYVPSDDVYNRVHLSIFFPHFTTLAGEIAINLLYPSVIGAIDPAQET